MKKLLLVLLILFSNQLIFSQESDNFPPRQREKINQFRKMKLIEILDLSEQESVKFFARYKEFENNIESRQKKKNNIINEIQKMVKEGENSFNEQKFNDLLKQISSIESEGQQIKHDFYNGLSDIIPKYKIAKLIVFEREFFNQLRNVVGKRGPGPGFRRDDNE